VVFGDGCGLREGDWLRTECRVMVNLDTLSWPVSRLGEALEALSARAVSVKSVQTPTPPQDLATAGAMRSGGGWRRRLATQVWRRNQWEPHAEVNR